MNRDIMVDMVTMLRDGKSGVRILPRAREFFFSRTSNPTLGSIQPPIQWVKMFISWGKSSRGVKLTTHPI